MEAMERLVGGIADCGARYLAIFVQANESFVRSERSAARWKAQYERPLHDTSERREQNKKLTRGRIKTDASCRDRAAAKVQGVRRTSAVGAKSLILLTT